MAKSDKSLISEQFAKLRNFGYRVYCFNSKTALPQAIKGFSDYVIMSKSKMIFIEVKLKGDRFSDEQKQFSIDVSSIGTLNKGIYYFTVESLDDAKKLIERILKNRL